MFLPDVQRMRKSSIHAPVRVLELAQHTTLAQMTWLMLLARLLPVLRDSRPCSRPRGPKTRTASTYSCVHRHEMHAAGGGICSRCRGVGAPSWGLPRRWGAGAAGSEAVRSPRFRGEGWLLRLSRLVEEPMRLWRRLTSAGLPCTQRSLSHCRLAEACLQLRGRGGRGAAPRAEPCLTHMILCVIPHPDCRVTVACLQLSGAAPRRSTPS